MFNQKRTKSCLTHKTFQEHTTLKIVSKEPIHTHTHTPSRGENGKSLSLHIENVVPFAFFYKIIVEKLAAGHNK